MRFLQKGKEAVEAMLNREGPLPLTPRMLAELLAGLPACREADSIAHKAAAANGYAVSARRPPPLSEKPANEAAGHEDVSTATSSSSAMDSQPSGRPLDAEAILSTGILGTLQSPAPHDFQAVAAELAGYLAGPPIDIWDYAILDGHLTADEPIQVIDGWELVTPTVKPKFRHLG